MEKEALSGLLLIDKPTGITSFDVIRQLRQHFFKLGYPKLKMGHSGTLDPDASGLLLVAVGKTTKKLESLIGLDKSYNALIRLGETSDTLDAEGQITEKKDASGIREQEIISAIESMIGCHDLEVPLYSAVKVSGRPLYSYARKGQTPPRIPIKNMCVRRATFDYITISTDVSSVSVSFKVSKGTYIRTLAKELGSRLDIPAMLVGLRRTEIGDFSIENAKKVNDIMLTDLRPL